MGRSGRRRRILPGDDAAIYNGKRRPVGSLLIESADSLQLIFDEEGNDVSEIHRGFLTVGKAGDPFPLKQESALVHHAMEDGGRMADRGDRLSGVVEGFD